MLSGLFVVTATATPAATQTTQVQRLIQAKLVGHTAFKASPTNLVEGIAKDGGPAAYTDDSLFPVDHSRANTGVGGSAATRTLAPILAPAAPAGRMPTRGSALSVKGLNAFDMVSTHGFNVEPPDQGLCAGNGRVIEMVNLVLRVYDANLHPVSGPEVLETFFGNPLAFGFGVPGSDQTVQGDPRCYWDAGSRRWYLSQLDLDESNGTSQYNLAVSQTSDPLGAYNLYSLDNTDSSNPGCAVPDAFGRTGCFGDQPLLGANQDALFISTNEFPIFINGFNGSVLYTIDKRALAHGAAFANTVIDYIGLSIPIPGAAAGSCAASGGAECWYSVQPAIAPTAASNDNSRGGVEYALSALDFVGSGDNRVALWAITNTSSIRRVSPSIKVMEATVSSETYAAPPSFVSQKVGPIPQGDSGRFDPAGNPQPEGPIQTNDDRMNATVYADGLIWGALTTKMTVVSQGKVGIAYFAVNPRLTHDGLTGKVAQQGYVVAPGNNVIFPSIGMDEDGNGIMSFTLTGNGYFPTAAYTTINERSGAGSVKIAALGQSPQDSFSEYQNLGNDQYRPRWGDYSAAVAAGNDIYFAAEYIQSPNCSDSDWAVDPTCGGTRSRSANWGTSLSKVHV